MKEGAQYSLSIRFGKDGFSLSMYDELGKLLTFKEVPFLLLSLSVREIINLLVEETEALINLKSIRFICESDIYTFVPALIFRTDEAGLYLNFHDKTEGNDRVLFNRLLQKDLVNVFSVPNALNVAINQLYPGSTIEHHLSWFFNEKIKQQNENSVQIWVRQKIMDVIVLTNGNVVLANSYTYETTEDFVYFTLDIFEQLSLNKEDYNVKLYNTKKQTDIHDCLQKYVNSCEIIE